MLAENDLVSVGLPVVVKVAKRLARRLGGRVEVDDLTAIGNLALVDAARTFDASRASFAAYVGWRAKYAILDVLRRDTGSRGAASRARAIMASERLSEAQAEVPEPEGPTTVEEDQAALASLLQEQAAALALGLLSAPADPGMVDSPEEVVHRAELASAVKGAVGTLPDRERALIERHYLQDEDFDDIAADLGISKSWASRLHEKAIRAVKEAVAGMT
jgi:RNA polymerase sigma factor for flagellar operon FliA